MMERIQSFFRGCSEIVFLQSSVCGLILVATMLLRPSMALSGVIAVLAAYGFAWLIGTEKQFRDSAFYIYNPLLVGLSLGYRFEFSPALFLLAVVAGVFTLILTTLLAKIVLSAKLPILSLPFALASPVLYLAVLRYSKMLGEANHGGSLLNMDLGLPFWLAGLFKSFGAIFFFPSVVVGILIALLILRSSRILIMLGVLGYYFGVFVRGFMFQSMGQSFMDVNSFNYILIAMAVGGVLLVPSFKSCLLALIGAAVAPLFLEALAVLGDPYGIPPFTLPFCLITLGIVYALRLANYPLLSTGIGASPEEVRENALVNQFRYRGNHRTLYLPFSGNWTICQGFNGRWTHQGIWRYAYDFTITDEHGCKHRSGGKYLQDYFCYRKPVLAPVRGQVVKVVDHLPDNPIGNVDHSNNWGNLVILSDPRGFYVEISHFVPNSIRFKVGDWVERGTILGLCGNSGYSPQPHIHVQVQANDIPGAATLPFSFVSYRNDDSYHANDLPAEGDRVEPLYLEKRLDELTNFLLDDVQEYEIFRHGRRTGRLKLRVGIALDGNYYFESERAKLYFGKHEGTFYIYRLDGNDPNLRMLFMALPRLPLTYKNDLQWHDYVPIGVAATGMKRGVARLATFFHPSSARVKVTQNFHGFNCIESVLESKAFGLKTAARIRLDEHNGFASVQIGNVELRKTSNGSNSHKSSSPTRLQSLIRV